MTKLTHDQKFYFLALFNGKMDYNLMFDMMQGKVEIPKEMMDQVNAMTFDQFMDAVF